MPIRQLPAQLANQIAAGEVVERPASVVKELVENSIDAGAKRIEVDIEQGGSKLIRIRDDGGGIAGDELALALMRHATSKIASFDDLQAITSLGFRGEALASISAVSRLTLTSCAQGATQAWQAYAEGRDMAVTVKPAAHPPGTTLEVRDLFYNTPARRKFLRTEKTEFMHIDEVLRRIALSRFDVALSLSHNGKRVREYRAVAQGDPVARRLEAVCGAGFMRQALEISWAHGELALQGWLALPGAAAVDEIQYSYVNGRVMRDRVISHALRQACEGCAPGWVLFLRLDPAQVDVNVHPAKQEVRFHQSRLVHDFICQGVMSALREAGKVQRDGFRSPSDKGQVSLREPGAASYGAKHGSRTKDGVAEDVVRGGLAKGGAGWPGASGRYQPRQGALYQQLLASAKADSHREGMDQGAVETPKEALPPLSSASSLLLKREISEDELRVPSPLSNSQTAENASLVLPPTQAGEGADKNERLVSPLSSVSSIAGSAQTPVPAAQAKACASAALGGHRQSFGRVLAIVDGEFALLAREAEIVLLSLRVAARCLCQAQLSAPVSGAAAQEETRGQPLLIPLRVKISEAERACLARAQDGLRAMGMDIVLEAGHITICALPLPMRQQNLHILIPELLGYLTTQAPFNATDTAGWLAERIAGQEATWSLAQAVALLARLERYCASLVSAPPRGLLQVVDLQPLIALLRGNA